MVLQIILASASPRRREILASLGIPFRAVTAPCDEQSGLRTPEALTEELSRRKAESARSMLQSSGELTPDTLIIGCDTVVYAGEKILGKPRDDEDAARMLRLLAGGAHTVVSGLTVRFGERIATAHETTRVWFDPMSEQEILAYVRSGEPRDKAGAYAVQGLARRWISGIEGDYFNVVGLPVHLLFRLLRNLGADV
ncbi:MAG: septum formation protein Maf [Clostridia bacterium]|nr:septum formation protein Maf [Clostridia bacterium]